MSITLAWMEYIHIIIFMQWNNKLWRHRLPQLQSIGRVRSTLSRSKNIESLLREMVARIIRQCLLWAAYLQFTEVCPQTWPPLLEQTNCEPQALAGISRGIECGTLVWKERRLKVSTAKLRNPLSNGKCALATDVSDYTRIWPQSRDKTRADGSLTWNNQLLHQR